MAYRLTRRAEDDVVGIFLEGLKHFGPRQADAYHEKLERAFELISHNPFMARERKDISPPVRVHPCGSHIVIYLVDSEGVLVVRVRHHKEDWIDHPAAD